MRDLLASLAAEIRRGQAALKEKAREARTQNPQLVLPVSKIQKSELSLSVCAVDGGLLAHRLHGHDIVLTRAVGVNFVYDKSVLASFAHHPSAFTEPKIEIKSALDDHEANVFRSLVRLKYELECALAVVEKYSPQLLLMDGSLLPVPSDRPSSESELAPLFSEILSLYAKLYAICAEKNCQLCGVIKDSRSRKLAKDLSLDSGCSDTSLCGHLLDQWERTCEFPYLDNKNKDFAFAERVKVFYLKPSERDLPLRIEFLGSGNDANNVASIICTLSAISENFAYPAILIEADMRVALDPKELEPIESSLLSLDLAPLRRNSRPFR